MHEAVICSDVICEGNTVATVFLSIYEITSEYVLIFQCALIIDEVCVTYGL